MELQELIEGLSESKAYSEPVDSVELRQTHISLVFLAGRHAYKIKKPVDLGFVDYTSLERRRHFCEEEVRLNRRLAPSVYLGVVPVTSDGTQFKMEGAGDVVEWAVKMERLPDSATLGAHLRCGDVDRNSIHELARRLARFHAQADGGPKVALGGSFEAVARNARENFEQSATHVGGTVSKSVHDRLRTLTEAALTKLHVIIASRASRGVPRDTHGDLRLDHVYWFPEKRLPDDWVVVDCIEFNERFRHADPIADIAFLAMELALEGRSNLAEDFVEAYLRETDDGEGRELLPFYRAYRATVRAKVQGMKLAAPEVPESEKTQAKAKAVARWLLALTELEAPGRKPCLVLVAGLPGSGKSTLAHRLAEAAGFSVIRSDVVRKELASERGFEEARTKVNENLYTEEWNDRTYRECLHRGEEILFEGGRLLIDASFQSEARRRLFLNAARRWGVSACLILCRADADIVRERLLRRKGDVSDADWAVHGEMARGWEEPGLETEAVTRRIDTGGTEDEALRKALDALRGFGLVGN
jgi:aminoglycoside phosphotransferase family enzyme/predicted kinase